MVTFKYYNKKFLVENKLNDANSLILLDTIFSWIFNPKHPQYKFINKKICFYISQTHLASLLDSVMNTVTINRKFSNFKKCKIINKETESKDRKVFYSFNWEIVRQCFATEKELKKIGYKNDWLKVLSDYEKGIINSYNHIKEDKVLLDSKDVNIQEKRKGYSLEAERLIRKLVIKNRDIFTNKLPEDYKDGRITNSYTKACKTIQDIYNGTFISSRFYPLSEKFLKNKIFDFENWKDKIKEVKGDWNKIHHLLLNAIKNYKLMFDDKRVPTKKGELTCSIQEWLYDSWNHGTKEPISYFIYSLEEPKFTTEQFSNIKADKIYDELPKSVSNYGNEMISNFFSGNSHPGIIWQHIREIYEWGNLILDFDENARYWISKNGNIIQKFCEYLKENNLSVSANTLDINKAIDCNGPWCWFISQAITEHSLNNNVVNCADESDFYDCYNSHTENEFPVF